VLRLACGASWTGLEAEAQVAAAGLLLPFSFFFFRQKTKGKAQGDLEGF